MHCKNLCKCYDVPLPSTKIKILYQTKVFQHNENTEVHIDKYMFPCYLQVKYKGKYEKKNVQESTKAPWRGSVSRDIHIQSPTCHS
jgi:hypothetical protein